ncbi:type II toxin-antitoxin system HicA family toxin [Campylobacter hepaticus]|uniref:type II toxin-antitoxin system HicA family toxin n=1 Tax=Campylobacter hepaticus TaxID=1813019 RepID=UPI0021AA9E1D|nr:type II toxin-antitoxin system HicA family toxin [Campylobacter hepaticus]
MSAKEKLIKSLKNNPKNVDFSVLKNLLLIMAMSVFIRVARIINLEKKGCKLITISFNVL